MRWLFTLMALAAGAWYLSNRQRRDRLQQMAQDRVPPDVQAQVKDTVATVTEMARSTGGNVAETAQNVASTVTLKAQDAASTVTLKAQDVAGTAQQAVGDAASNVQEASQGVADRIQQAAQGVTDRVEQAAGTGTPTEREEESGTATPAASSIATDVDTPPPAVDDMVRTETADVAEQVDTLRAWSEEPPDPAEKSAGLAGDTSGLNTTPTAPGQMFDVAGGGQVEIIEGRDEGTAPVGQRPHPIAGEGTTTAGGGTVNPFAPAPGGDTSTGIAEPLPEGLTADEPGAGGPAGSSRAPTLPDSTETPTIGMEQPPVVDRREIAERTSGDYIGNKKTRVFHAATAANLPGEDNRVYFETIDEALAAGFRAADNDALESAGT